MPSSSKIFPISGGTPLSTSTGLTFLGMGEAGERGALRRLTHPNSSFPPIVYFSNPDRTFNIDNEVLPAPRVSAHRGLESTTLVRFEDTIDDVIVTEIWTAIQGRRLSMPTFFFRQLYEYLLNEPDYAPAAQTYIQYEPRDRNAHVYNVEMMRVAVGGGAQNNQLFDISDIRQKGGKYDPNQPNANIMNSSDGLSALETGLIDRTVQLQFKIVSLVS